MDFVTWFFQNLVRPMFWFQPLFYTFHGWLATEMALWMLFHPYEPVFVPGTKLQLPFTPGIFPRGRHKLSVSIANTITDILLTQEDLTKQAEKLITEDNIHKTLDALFESVAVELRDITHIRRIYRYVENLLPPLLQKVANDAILGLEQGQDKYLNVLIEQVFQKAVPHLRVSEAQADFLAKVALDSFLTPSAIRHLLIDVLNSETIRMLETVIRERVGGGLQGFIVRFVDIQGGLHQFRDYLLDDPENAEYWIAQFLVEHQTQAKLAQQLLKFSPQALPVETLDEIKGYLTVAGRQLLIERRETIVEAIGQFSEEATHSITASVMHLDFKTMADQWLPGFKRDLAHFIYTYLNKELETMMSKALPAISLNTVIMDKIDQFSAQQLEQTIHRICHRELRWLAFLGAFLGFWLGLVSNVLTYWWHPILP